MYFSVSCIQPMFHLKWKPRPPAQVGRETAGNAVLSSARVMASGRSPPTTSLSRFRKEMASRFSRPPWALGIHSPGLRL